jgi:hypothetical protein
MSEICLLGPGSAASGLRKNMPPRRNDASGGEAQKGVWNPSVHPYNVFDLSWLGVSRREAEKDAGRKGYGAFKLDSLRAVVKEVLMRRKAIAGVVAVAAMAISAPAAFAVGGPNSPGQSGKFKPNASRARVQRPAELSRPAEVGRSRLRFRGSGLSGPGPLS